MIVFCKIASRLYEMNTFFENVAPVRMKPLLFGLSFSMRGRSGCEPYPSKVSRPPCKFEGSFWRGPHMHHWFFKGKSMVFNDFLQIFDDFQRIFDDFLYIFSMNPGRLTQLVRVPPLQGGSREFESLNAHRLKPLIYRQGFFCFP